MNREATEPLGSRCGSDSSAAASSSGGEELDHRVNQFHVKAQLALYPALFAKLDAAASVVAADAQPDAQPDAHAVAQMDAARAAVVAAESVNPGATSKHESDTQSVDGSGSEVSGDKKEMSKGGGAVGIGNAPHVRGLREVVCVHLLEMWAVRMLGPHAGERMPALLQQACRLMQAERKET